MLKQYKMLSSRAAMVLVRAAENEMLQPHTGLQVQPHKDHKYRDLFPSIASTTCNIEINAIFICVLISSGDKYDNGVITKARPRYPYWGKSSRPDKNRNPQPSSESTGMRAFDILIIFCKVALPYGMK